MKVIYVITPSSNIIDESGDIENQIKKAKIILKELFVKVILGDLFNKSFLWYAGNIIDRVKEIHDGFLDKKIDFIISSQGGYNSNELLNKLDYDLIKNNYKPIIGLSDITILLNAIFKKTGKITYYGYDFIWQIGKSAKEFSKTQLNNFLNNGKLENRIIGKNLTNYNNGEGILIGGCIPSYSLILGTEYDPIELDKNFIFFIEDIGEPAERVISYTFQLINNIKFRKNCRGFIIGNFSFCKFENNKKYDLDIEILNVLKSLKIPILKIDRIGHIVENYILPIGKNVNIINNNLILNYGE